MLVELPQSPTLSRLNYTLMGLYCRPDLHVDHFFGHR